MIFTQTRTFEKELRKLKLSNKHKNDIFSDFEEMTSERASNYSYYMAGIWKTCKKYKKGRYRISFAYCSECINKYREYVGCEFCDEENLERIVLIHIELRKEGTYR